MNVLKNEDFSSLILIIEAVKRLNFPQEINYNYVIWFSSLAILGNFGLFSYHLYRLEIIISVIFMFFRSIPYNRVQIIKTVK